MITDIVFKIYKLDPLIKRNALKTISWRIIGSVDTVILGWIVTGNLGFGAKIGCAELLTKVVLYYLHERFWQGINIGLPTRLQKNKVVKFENKPHLFKNTGRINRTDREGKGVNGFTLDPSIGEFCLSHPNLRIPKTGTIYSVNEGNYVHFPKGVKQYIKYCQVEDAATDRPYTSRYIGSMVADVHRNLIKGGIFVYPVTASAPNGKLRLVYECNPMAFIIEQAGGR